MQNYKSLVLCLFALTFSVQCASKNPDSVRAENTKNIIHPKANSISYYHFLLGELSYLDSNSKVALEHFRYAAQYDTSSNFLKLKQAEQLAAMGNSADAKELLSQIKDSDDPEYHLLNAKIAAIDLDFKQSEESLDHAIHIYRQNYNFKKVREITLMKVALLSDAHEYQPAIDSLNVYIKDAPDDEIAYYFLGKIYSVLQKKEKSIAAYRTAIRLRPQFVTASKALGLEYELDGQNAKAIEIYQQALVYGGNDIEVRQKLANLYLTEQNYKMALRQFDALNMMNPEDTQTVFRTALLYLKLDHYKKAEKLFKHLLKGGDIAQDRINFYLGALYEEENNFGAALSAFLKLAPDSTYYVDAQLQAAYISSNKLNNDKKAASILTKAAGLEPTSQKLYLALAVQYEQMNKMADAIRILNTANRAIPNNPKILFVLGIFLDKAGDEDAGIQMMKQVLKINPNDAHAMNHIGYIYAKRKIHLNEAESLLLKAIQLEPNNPYIIDSLGWLYYQKAAYHKAEKFLQRAIKRQPDEPEILEHLADVYRKLGLYQKALQEYRRVVATTKKEETKVENPDTKEIQERNKRIQHKIASLVSDKTF